MVWGGRVGPPVHAPHTTGGRDLYTLYSVYTLLLTLPQTTPSSPQGGGDLYTVTVYSAHT